MSGGINGSRKHSSEDIHVVMAEASQRGASGVRDRLIFLTHSRATYLDPDQKTVYRKTICLPVRKQRGHVEVVVMVRLEVHISREICELGQFKEQTQYVEKVVQAVDDELKCKRLLEEGTWSLVSTLARTPYDVFDDEEEIE